MLTDLLNERRRLKFLGVSRGMLSWELFFTLTPQSPLSWVSESFRQDIGKFHSPQVKPCNFERFLFIKNVSVLWKIRPISVKTVETGVDPRLTGVLFFFLLVFYTFVLFLSSSHRESLKEVKKGREDEMSWPVWYTYIFTALGDKC